MINSHIALGIAQTVFYIPAVSVAIYLAMRHARSKQRMWWSLTLFSLIRLAGGPIIIVLEHNPQNIGLIIAALILLGVGTIPLLVADLGYVKMLLESESMQMNALNIKVLKGLRLAFIPAVALLSAGGGVSSSSQSLGRMLSLVGYIVFAAILITLIALEIRLWIDRGRLSAASRKILKGILSSAPFLVVRNVYGLLDVAFEDSSTLKWNPVFGSTIAFAIMALLMEYIVICIYFYIGYTLPHGGLVVNSPCENQEQDNIAQGITGETSYIPLLSRRK